MPTAKSGCAYHNPRCGAMHLLWWTILAVVCVVTTTAAAGSPPQAHNHHHLRSSSSSDDSSRNLIVGGTNAAQGRFPSFVALVNHDQETICGGTLIAPDVVLTAAHCRSADLSFAMVGKYTYNVTDYSDGYEQINIQSPHDMGATADYMGRSGNAIADVIGFVHPLHSYQERTYDVMLLKLERPAATGTPLMKVNFDPAVPAQRSGGNEITVIGMGRLEVGGPKPDVLQQVHLDFVPYDECIDFTSYNVDYKYELMPDMICTTGRGIYGNRGQCYGDSGGPYLMMNGSPEEDVQIGVVSWAVNCANPVLPMVGARTSTPPTVKFIRDVTCEIGTNVPDYLCNSDFTTIVTEVVNGPVAGTIVNPVSLSVNLFFDPFPHEISFEITNADKSIVYASVPVDAHVGIDHAFHQVVLPADEDCLFIIHDARGDGVFGDEEATAYEIAYGGVIVLQGNGKFATTREEAFRVPIPISNGIVVEGTPIDGYNGNSVPVALPGLDTLAVYVYFQFDDYQEDLSWVITDGIDTTIVYKRVAPDTYRFGKEVREEVRLPAGRSFQFVVNDRRGTDEFRAFQSYRLSYIDASSGDEIPLLESQGQFVGESKTETFSLPGIAQFTDEGGQDVNLQTQAPIGDGALALPPDLVARPPGQEDQICIQYHQSCVTSQECCSGRCVDNSCRSSPTGGSRNRSGLRLGRTRAGGAASSRSIPP